MDKGIYNRWIIGTLKKVNLSNAFACNIFLIIFQACINKKSGGLINEKYRRITKNS